MLKINWKVFLISLIGQFLISSLLYFGIKAPNVLNFLTLPNLKASYAKLYDPAASPNPNNIWDQILPKLEQGKDQFGIKTSYQIIQPALADTSYDYDSANSYLVINFDSGEVLGQKDKDKQIPIASLTKLMSAVVALDLAQPSDQFTVSQAATEVEPTSIGVKVGEQLSLEELLHAMLMTSANDAAQVVKDGVDQKYGQNIFIQAMNDKAKYLGLQNSHFTNPQGFDDNNHYSSASDLAVLTHYALTHYPILSQIVKKDYTVLEATSTHHEFDLNNWNGLLSVYPGVMGVKIGNTDNAQCTTIVLSEREGKRVLVVLLGAPHGLQRDLWASELLNLGFAKYNIPNFEVTEAMLQSKYSTWKYFQ